MSEIEQSEAELLRYLIWTPSAILHWTEVDFYNSLAFRDSYCTRLLNFNKFGQCVVEMHTSKNRKVDNRHFCCSKKMSITYFTKTGWQVADFHAATTLLPLASTWAIPQSIASFVKTSTYFAYCMTRLYLSTRVPDKEIDRIFES